MLRPRGVLWSIIILALICTASAKRSRSAKRRKKNTRPAEHESLSTAARHGDKRRFVELIQENEVSGVVQVDEETWKWRSKSLPVQAASSAASRITEGLNRTLSLSLEVKIGSKKQSTIFHAFSNFVESAPTSWLEILVDISRNLLVVKHKTPSLASAAAEFTLPKSKRRNWIKIFVLLNAGSDTQPGRILCQIGCSEAQSQELDDGVNLVFPKDTTFEIGGNSHNASSSFSGHIRRARIYTRPILTPPWRCATTPSPKSSRQTITHKKQRGVLADDPATERSASLDVGNDRERIVEELRTQIQTCRTENREMNSMMQMMKQKQASLEERVAALESCECIPMCLMKGGVKRRHGEVWRVDDCTTCECTSGEAACEEREGCKDENVACSSNPCANGGTCEDVEGAFRCRCRQGFHGDSCEFVDYCDAGVCQNGGGCELLEDGGYLCRCRSGFSGRNCESRLDLCLARPCKNSAECVDLPGGYVCKCTEGFRGRHCQDSDDCYSAPCLNGGVCTSLSLTGYTCRCRSSFYGRNCEHRDVCISSPCLNGGRCARTTGSFSYTCDCVESFHGPRCEHRDPCFVNPCLNGGRCRGDPLNGGTFTCRCPDGFEGDRCQDEDSCFSDPCRNGGRCINRASPSTGLRFTCQCPDAYVGARCELQDSCHSSPCVNGGQCLPLSSVDSEGAIRFQCRCTDAYYGERCELKAPCASDPCRNGGTCENRPSGAFYCRCRATHYGRVCEHTDYCRARPCMHGATCTNKPSKYDKPYTCDCTGRFMGPDCEVEDLCLRRPCLNGGTCTMEDGDYACTCRDSYLGRRCEEVDYCSENPCLNGGRCENVDSGARFRCICSESHTGRRCELPHPCRPNPCLNTGRCRVTGRGSYECQCPPSYRGRDCKLVDHCRRNPCRNGGTCLNDGDAFTCDCQDGYSGRTCDEFNACASNPCLNGATCLEEGGRYRCVCPNTHAGNKCQHACNVCAYGKEEGACRASEGDAETRWYFNKFTQKCQQFEYSGCGGNGNNFVTRQACRQKCLVGACCMFRQSIIINGHSSPNSVSYLCQTLSVGQCKRMDLQRTEVQVIAFHSGVDCSDYECGSPSKCSFGGRDYLENSRINIGCDHSCTCRTGGNIKCACEEKSLRREIRRLTTRERETFQNAVRTLRMTEIEQGRNAWDQMRDEYVRSLPVAQSSRYFLLWNRAFLRKMELLLQTVDCEVTIPYYDFTQDAGRFADAIIWQPNFFGGEGECVPDHPFRRIDSEEAYPWVPCLSRSFSKSVSIPSMVDVSAALSSRTYEQLSGKLLTLVSHVHAFIGGNMATSTKAHDPLFYSIHAYLDYLFAEWQKAHPGSNDYQLVRSVDSVPFGMLPKDLWDGACVEYADWSQRVACNRSDTSEELFATDGFNLQGYDRHGFDRDGFDKHGFNAIGRDVYGRLDTRAGYGYNGFDAVGYARTGYDRRGYNRFGFDKEGRDRDGFDAQGFDKSGFNRYGLNVQGFDRRGFNVYGVNRYGNLDSSQFYDAETGLNDCCFGRDGLTENERDRFGFDVEGYDEQACKYFFHGPHSLHYRDKLWTMLSPQRPSFLSTVARTCGPLESLSRDQISLNWVAHNSYPTAPGISGTQQTRPSTAEKTNEIFTDRYCFDVDMFLTWCNCDDENYPAICTTNPCANARCALHPNARCVVNKCGRTCTADFFLDGRRVNCDNPCDPNPCQNGGTCKPSRFSSETERFQCICPDEYVGSICERPAPDTCMLSKKVGTCQASVTRWYYNFATASCERFTYSGCGGNSNNFRSKKACDLRCSLGACCYRLPKNSTFAVGFDRDGFDKYGFNALGFNRRGQQQSAHDSMPTGNRIHPPKGYGHAGFDIYGYDINGYDRQGYNRDGFHKDTGYNRKGFDSDGQFDELTEFGRDGFNDNGLDRAGYTCSGIDRDGFNQLGLYYDFEYRCDSLHLTECEALKDPGQLGIPFEVISFAPGLNCDQVQCGEECGCKVDGRDYRFGEKFLKGCESCTCTLGGIVECTCQRLGKRREIRDLTDAEREEYASAVRKMYKTNKWEEFATQHAQHMPKANGVASSLPWHRYFLRTVEREIQKHSSCDVFIPYFDWTIDVGKMEDSEIWQASFFGSDGDEDTNCVHHHAFMRDVHWHPCIKRKFDKTISLPDAVNFYLLLQEPDYDNFRMQLEMMSALFHLWVGGHMASPFSPYDPLYLSHWAFIDSIWNEWQKKNPMGISRFPAEHRYVKMIPFLAAPDNVLSSEQQMCLIYIPPTIGSPCNVTGHVGWPPSTKDESGLDRHGFDERGYDLYGFNASGINKHGSPDPRNLFDENGYSTHGYHRTGFDKSGWDKYGYTKFDFNRDGFDVEGYDGSGYDRYGFDRDGRTPFGMFRNMSIAPGFDAGYVASLFDRYGYNRHGFDNKGFDHRGFDVFGFTRNGLDQDSCDYYFNGPHYMRYFYHVQEQLSGLGEAMLRNVKRICPPITPLPDYWASHVWMEKMAKVRGFEKTWSTEHPFDESWRPRSSSVTEELLWLPATPDQQFCFDTLWFSGCPLGTRMIECTVDKCADSVCASHPRAECRMKQCGACYPEFYNGETGEVYQCYGCISKSGEMQNEGSTWHEGCDTCVCQAGLITCSPMPCPSHSCTHPAPGPDQCCDVCDGCEYESRTYSNKQRFRPNACEVCQCIDGSVMCHDVTSCPPVDCEMPVKLPGECCPTCSTDCRGRRNLEAWVMDKCHNCSCVADTIVCSRNHCPVLQCKHPRTSAGECCPECMGCVYKERNYRHRQNFMEDSCSQCTCRFGTVTCTSQQCPPLTCKHKERPPGSCCPRCRKGCEYEGRFYDNGVPFQPQNNPCLQCLCQDGRPKCSRRTCPRASCLRPIVPEGKCCPECVTCQKGSVVYNEGQMWTSGDKCKKCTCTRGQEVCRNIIPCRDQCSHGLLRRGQCCPECSRCAYHGKIFQHLDPFEDPHDVCKSCTCQSGNVVCSTINCPDVRCSEVETPEGECCPRCKMCVYDGVLRDHGSSWRIPQDPCTTCSCQEGAIECEDEKCAPPRCDYPGTPSGSCCPTCRGCFHRGRNYINGANVEADDACSTCTCSLGNVVCREKYCPRVECRNPVKKSGECCPSCAACEYEGQTHEDGDVFLAPRRPCLECTCKGGAVNCRRLDLSCERTPCSNPGRSRTQCCPSCESCEYRRRMYDNGATFSPSPATPCTTCVCSNGTVNCQTEACTPLSCSNPVRPAGKCCPVCEECVHNGRTYSNGERWQSDSCTNCQCLAGRIQCAAVICAELACRHPSKPPGECCSSCSKCFYEGSVYSDGRRFRNPSDRCSICTCRAGTVTCVKRSCPRLDCSNSSVALGACCPSCPTDCELQGKTIPNGETVPDPDDKCRDCTCSDGDVTCDRRECPLVAGCTHPTSGRCCRDECDGCLYRGSVMRNGASITSRDPCRKCTCLNGNVRCVRQRCSRATCENAKMMPGKCCPECPEKPDDCELRGKVIGHDTQFQDRCKVCNCADGDITCTPQPCPSVACTSPVKNGCCLSCDHGCRVDGTTYAEGQELKKRSDDKCSVCHCRKGNAVCRARTCEDVDCPYPRSDGCCPACDGCSYEGQNYDDGTSFPDPEDECNVCICEKGRVLCSTKQCTVPCTHALKPKDACCPICGGDCLYGGKIFSRQGGMFSLPDDVNECSLCVCNAGSILCQHKPCPISSCRHPVVNECGCSMCNDGCQHNGVKRRNRETFPNPDDEKCSDCYCSNGNVVCGKRTCESASCTDPVRDECECPKCNQCSYAGRSYDNGDTFDDAEDVCNVCECQDGNVDCRSRTCRATTCSHPALDGCGCRACHGCSYGGVDHDNLEKFQDPANQCNECLCQLGAVTCTKVSCPATPCSNPVMAEHDCCPKCVGMCYSHGRSYEDGATFTMETDVCSTCHCSSGDIRCVRQRCDVRCTNPIAQSKCCPDCSACLYQGVRHEQGESFSPRGNSCKTCSCHRGNVICATKRCPELDCDNPRTVRGKCCPSCPAPHSIECVVNGRAQEAGATWIQMDHSDVCQECTCLTGGIISCGKAVCEDSCTHPVPQVGKCCSQCDGCYYDDHTYRNGMMFHPNECKDCACANGNVRCVTKSCPPLSCSVDKQVKPPGECCARCKSCVMGGKVYSDYQAWTSPDDHCQECRCVNGVITCAPVQCLQPCQLMVKMPGRCCPVCTGCFYNNKVFQIGESFNPNRMDPCETCECQASPAGAPVLCCKRLECPSLADCPRSCIRQPRPGQCCPTCTNRPECGYGHCSARSHGSQIVPAENRCFACNCKVENTWLCMRDPCKNLDCPIMKRYTPQGSCCPVCDECHLDMENIDVPSGKVWRRSPCEACRCDKGSVTCIQQECQPMPMKCKRGTVPHKKAGQCCHGCLNVDASCTYDGREVRAHHKWKPDDCTTCTCFGGKVECTTLKCRMLMCRADQAPTAIPGECCPKCMPRPASCVAFGDPHYKTFDGRMVHFQGTCQYLFTADCSESDFKVIVHNSKRAGNGRPVSWTEQVTIITKGGSVSLMKDYSVRLNGTILRHLPISLLPHYYIEVVGNYMLLRTDLGVHLSWNGRQQRLEVTVPGNYKRRTCGLCGNFNNYPQDDVKLHNSRMASNDAEFGNDWKVNIPNAPACQDVQDVNPCNGASYAMRTFANEKCQILRSPTFSACHTLVNPETYFATCVYDVCACGENDHSCLCDVLEAYAAQCRRSGAVVRWRGPTLCAVVCSYDRGYVFDECGSPCKRTCANRNLPPEAIAAQCYMPCVSGCQCPAGKVEHAGRCIYPEHCPVEVSSMVEEETTGLIPNPMGPGMRQSPSHATLNSRIVEPPIVAPRTMRSRRHK